MGELISETSAAVLPQGAAPSSTPKPRLAYLLSRYPAISHTFFLHEVLGLRSLGLEIRTASINLPDRPIESLPADEASEAKTTFYLKGLSKQAAVAKLLPIALANPGVVLRGLSAVRKIRNLTTRKRAIWLAYLAEALLVGDWMRRNHLPHLHVHFGGPVASVGYLTSVAWKLPYSITIHGPEELQDYTAYQLDEKLRQASFVLCISDFAKSQIMQRLPVEHWSKLEVARLGVTEQMLASHTVKAAPGDTVHVVCVGRLVPEKGQRLLLEAISRLRSRGTAITATLVGDGVERERLQQYAVRSNLTPAVTFAGARSHTETLALLQQADIFALPSFAEGIPVALMEAMSHEIPCISTTVAGISELIRHGQDGLLVAPSNVEALTEALALLAGDAALRERMGKSSRERVLDQYRLSKNHVHLAKIFTTRLGARTA